MPRGMGYTGSHDTLGASEGVTLTQTMWAEKQVRVDILRKNQGALTRRRNRCGQANHRPSQWCPELAPVGSERWLCTSFHMPPSVTAQRESSRHRTSKHYPPGLKFPPESPLLHSYPHTTAPKPRFPIGHSSSSATGPGVTWTSPWPPWDLLLQHCQVGLALVPPSFLRHLASLTVARL